MFWVWIVFFLVLLGIEVATVNLVSIWFAIGALVTSVVAYFVDNIAIQFAVFASMSALSFILMRPFVKKFNAKAAEPTNLDRVVGKIGYVTEAIRPLYPGEVQIDGKKWTAVADDVIDVHTKVDILAIEGVKLRVQRIREEK